jgi:hypothetical protein
MLRSLKLTSLVLLLMPALTSCAPKAPVEDPVVKPPSLTTTEAHSKKMTDKMSGNSGNPFAAMANLSEIMSDLVGGGGAIGRETARVGKNVKIVETVVNEGGPSEGLRFVIRGKALTSAVVGPPKKATITSYEAPPKATGMLMPSMAEPKVLATEELVNFVPAANGAWAGNLPKFPFQSRVNISISLPGQQEGTGDIQLDVYPADPQGTTRANFVEHVSVYDPVKRKNDEEEDELE